MPGLFQKKFDHTLKLEELPFKVDKKAKTVTLLLGRKLHEVTDHSVQVKKMELLIGMLDIVLENFEKDFIQSKLDGTADPKEVKHD